MRRLLLTLAVLLICSAPAAAADFSKFSQTPVILNSVILVGAIACLVIAIRLFNLVKGGALAKGCQFWVISFVTLLAGQALALAEKLEVFALNFDVAAVLYAATVMLWFAGLAQTRKVLG
ncbi:MAG: hypothetical protein R3F48_07885 [Candidatus Zixiibacteriota bacterium]